MNSSARSVWNRFSWIFLVAGLSSAQAHAVLPVDGLRFPPGMSLYSDSDQYRIGSGWGKVPVTAATLATATPEFKRAAQATAKVSGGTGFYLGKFNGLHVIATNHHVCPAAFNCLGIRAQFPLLGLQLKINKFLGHWTDIDLALLAIEVKTAEEEQKLAVVAGNFNFRKDLIPGQQLLTIGFGVAANPGRALVANQDHDCKVFSGKNEFKFMADPDDVNPGEYHAWSFANGCDVSHGDSGSAMVDRSTGEVLGIIWTGRIPKSSLVQDSSFLDHLLRSQGPEIWKELSYAVPASKIGEHLKKIAADSATSPELRLTLLSILSN